MAILEQKYQFYLRHCKSKVVRYESTSLLIPGSSLYDDFPERYGYLMVFFTFRKHGNGSQSNIIDRRDLAEEHIWDSCMYKRPWNLRTSGSNRYENNAATK